MTEAILPDRPEPIRPRVALVTTPTSAVDDRPGLSVPNLERSNSPSARDLEVQVLLARIEELEMRLRERDEKAQLRDVELQALERDLAIKEAYVARLEFERQLLDTEIGQVRDRAAELFGDLERAEARIVELGALAHDIQSQSVYRLAVRAHEIIEDLGPLGNVLGRLLRLVANRSR